MKVCLYAEGIHQLKMVTECGITSAFAHLQEALKRAGVPYTLNINEDFDILHMNLGIGPLSISYAHYFKKKGKKIIIHAHSTAEDFKGSFILSERLTPLIRKILPFFYGQADLVLCPSEYTKRLLKSYGMKNEIIAISNGVDIHKFVPDKKKRNAYRKREGINNMLVFSVGNVFKKKGCLDFAKIAEEMPQYSFRWFGTIYNPLIVDYSGMEKYLKGKIKNLKFTGFFKDIIEAFSAGDIFFFPSYDENQGIAVLEAASMGKPMIVRDIPVYRGWLFHGKNCLKGKNNAQFKKYIELLAKDKKLREKLGKNARKLAEENSLEKIGQKLKKIYEKVLAK